MAEFKDLQKEICKKAKTAEACVSEYKRALSAKDEAELLKVIYDNIGWCSSNKIISDEYFSRFDILTFQNSGIANTGQENTGFVNSGDRNSGDRNSGDRNSGDRNSGDRNSGDSNSGDRNSGDRNSGDRNSGDRNSGNWNSGDSNSGNWNSGDRNSGDSNSGNWNSGDRNSGDSNSGYRNSGAFCTDSNPKMILFNKPCASMTVKQWEQSKACQLMGNIENTLWIPFHAMSEEEKAANPKAETTEGFLKTIPMKEAWKNVWGNFTDESKNVFLSLENFDWNVFTEITGIEKEG